MAAPIIVGVIGLLTGAGVGTYAVPALIDAAKVEAVVSAIYAKIPEVCNLTGPLVLDLQAKFPNSK